MRSDGNPTDRWRWWWALLPAGGGAFLAWFLYQLALDSELWTQAKPWLWMPLWPVFGDLDETLLHFRQAGQGLDPLADPASTFAYPRAFLLLRLLHLQDLSSPAAGWLLGTAWVAGVIVVLRPRTFLRALGTTLLFVSPPMLLGLERGNFDLLLFLLLAALAAGWAGCHRTGPAAALAFATAAAAFLKIYPAFALMAGVWIDRERRRLAWLAAIVLVAAFWITHRAELLLVMTKFPFGTGYSWGCFVLFDRLELYLPRGISWIGPEGGPTLKSVAVVCYGAAVLGSLILGRRWRSEFARLATSRLNWAYFWMGTAICCGSFVSTNYAYRWVFLVLAFPLLFDGLGSGVRIVRRWAWFAMGAAAISLAAPLEAARQGFFLVQAANWAVVLALATGLFALSAGPGSAETTGRPGERAPS